MPVSELIITAMDGSTRGVPLQSDRLGLGRAATNDLCFPDDSGLSRQHLTFERIGDAWQVRDLGSKNGTLVNNERITGPVALQHRDRISAGHLMIEFHDGKDREQKTVLFVDTKETAPSTVATVVTDLRSVLAGASAAAGGVVATGASGAAAVEAVQAPALSGAKPIEALIRAGQELASHRPLDELFPLILNLAIDAVGASRGVLMTLENGELVVKAHKGENFVISSMVRDKILKERNSLLVLDAQFDQDFRERHSIVQQRVRSMIGAPLETREQVIGLIYVDTSNVVRPFGKEELNLLTVMANVAAIRIEQARMAAMELAAQRAEQELSQAADIQRRLLPITVPVVPGVELAGHNVPCRTVGGDYYDFIPDEIGRVLLVVGDVAGKGMPAALMMSNLQARLQALAEAGMEPARMVTQLNKSIHARSPQNRFITLFAGWLDPSTGELVYCNAGHNPPLLLRRDGALQLLEGGGMVLGIIGPAQYTQHAVKLEHGDIVALFSDGVTEACPPDRDEEYGEARLGASLRANAHLPAEEMIRAAMTDLGVYTAGCPLADDVTLVVARLR